MSKRPIVKSFKFLPFAGKFCILSLRKCPHGLNKVAQLYSHNAESLREAGVISVAVTKQTTGELVFLGSSVMAESCSQHFPRKAAPADSGCMGSPVSAYRFGDLDFHAGIPA